MPRGRRKIPVKTLEERIIETEQSIEQKKQELSALRASRKQLIAEREHMDLVNLYEVVKTSGKSPAEFIELIAGK